VKEDEIFDALMEEVHSFLAEGKPAAVPESIPV
jgi:hypothetical protein